MDLLNAFHGLCFNDDEFKAYVQKNMKEVAIPESPLERTLSLMDLSWLAKLRYIY